VRAFSPEAEQVLSRFFAERHIDAEPRRGKQEGAFCEAVARDQLPYVLLNFTGSHHDVQVLAHELGHGLHYALAQRRQSPLSFETGSAIAEVASTFTELLLLEHLLERERDSEARAALTSSWLENGFNTIFNQTVMTRYEQRSYAAKSNGESLNPERLSGLWIDEARKYFADTVEIPEGYRLGWSPIPHFISTRFYTYTYSFAQLVSLALYVRYRQNREAFVPKYLEFLEAGGSKSPAELLLPMGLDIADSAWVGPAFDLIGSWIDDAATASTGEPGRA
jgi:oligoendopeptidase F